jgi:hypothetical protein
MSAAGTKTAAAAGSDCGKGSQYNEPASHHGSIPGESANGGEYARERLSARKVSPIEKIELTGRFCRASTIETRWQCCHSPEFKVPSSTFKVGLDRQGLNLEP